MRSVILTTLLCCAAATPALAQLPRLTANDNLTPAGSLKNGVLELHLVITKGMWHPDGENDAGIDVIAIGEIGKPASVPAPLIRVPRGTLVRTTLKNGTDESLSVIGLQNSHELADSVRMQPGEIRAFLMRADRTGSFVYGAWRRFRVATPNSENSGNDMTAFGGFVVDEPGARIADRVMVINMVVDSTRVHPQRGTTAILATINGRSWPHTERLTHDVGDTIVWRVINASLIPHPMHLHGFYFDVLGRQDTIYGERAIRKVVTERLLTRQSMTMRWIPERAGNWLFHCHLTAHTQLHGAVGGDLKASGESHVHDAMHGMSNLLVGVTVRGHVAADHAARAQQRLLVQRKDSAADTRARFSFELNGAPNVKAAGPTILVHRNEPTAITVVNQAGEPTAVHWHGIELESYSDGVAGFGGNGTRISPLIAPSDSFVAHMTPPRAGTFIYHTHIDELRQQRGGLYGALLVIDPATYDSSTDRVILLGSQLDDPALVLFNGEVEPDLPLQVGRTYRLRLIHIMVARPAMYVVLLDPEGKQEEWQLVAKDGADLPAHQSSRGPARQAMSNGETYDVLFTPGKAGTWRLEARANDNSVFSHMTITAR